MANEIKMNITIPPEALEAGARAMFKERYEYDPVSPDDDNQMNLSRVYARAAFTAMVEHWPGMTHNPAIELYGVMQRPYLILPLPQKNPDA